MLQKCVILLLSYLVHLQVLGGAVYSQSISGEFSHTTINGQGFMALAAMIFGKWHPLGALGAALFFGFAQALSIVGGQIPLCERSSNLFLTHLALCFNYYWRLLDLLEEQTHQKQVECLILKENDN